MTWIDGVNGLPAVSLEDLNSEAALQTRVDRKYVVDAETWAQVLEAHAPQLRVLEVSGSRGAHYRSVYYDTPGFDSYLAAARRRPHRYKVRVREYLDSGLSAVEVKLRSGRGETIKHRHLVDGALRADDVVAFASTFPLVRPDAASLEATLETRYTRTTLLHPQGRVTVDQHVTAIGRDGQRVDYGDLLIVETKSSRAAGAMDRALWARGIRPERLSKYATSLAAIHPELPANRWHRSLNRHLGAA